MQGAALGWARDVHGRAAAGTFAHGPALVVVEPQQRLAVGAGKLDTHGHDSVNEWPAELRYADFVARINADNQ
jgi:hypothetical protein